MDYQLFLKCIQFADAYKTSKPNIYFFLKDCAIQRIYKENGNRFPTPDSQNICNQFQMEMQQAQWQRNKISKQEYQEFLEGLFKKVDFSRIDLESYKILKALTENIGKNNSITLASANSYLNITAIRLTILNEMYADNYDTKNLLENILFLNAMEKIVIINIFHQQDSKRKYLQ